MAEYYIRFESARLLAEVTEAAKADGTWSAEHSDWYEPSDIGDGLGFVGTLAKARAMARIVAAERSVFGSVELCEVVPDYHDGVRLSDDHRFLETVDAP